MFYGNQSYINTGENFSISWTIVIHHTLCKMVTAGNNIYGWSDKGALIKMTQEKENVLKLYGKNIKYFTFIKPTDKMIATIDEENYLQLWKVSTGEFKNEVKLNGVVTSLRSNPYFYYVAVSFKNGIVQLISTNPKLNNLNYIAKLVLCDEDITSVLFSFDGKECIAICYTSGQFYRVNIEVGQSCYVTREHHLGERVVDVELTDNNKSSFLTVLYGNLNTPETAGNNIVIFDKNFKTVFKLQDSQHYYTSTFKWISFVSHNIINVAFTVMLSRQVHLLTINVVQNTLLEFQVIPLDHNLRSVNVFTEENYCVTFCNDGTYNLYEFDDNERLNKIIMVTCCHWQTGGLKAAQIDSNARNILTLSSDGNFMCTSFNDTCKYTRRSHKVKKPIIIRNIETKGIGFENENGNRITWTTMKQENELKESQTAYRKQKNQIVQDFDAIKKQLLALFEANVNGPENVKISVEAFDLNDDYKQWYREKCALERQNYKNKILEKIQMFNNETKDILKKCWESLVIKPKSIYCLKKIYKVDNYAISIKDQEVIDKANEIKQKRLSRMHDEEISSQDTSTVMSIDFGADNETILSENSDYSLTDIVLFESISHKFSEIIGVLSLQKNYHKLETVEDEITLLRVRRSCLSVELYEVSYTINMLKHSFNELFDEVFDKKDQQLENLEEFNERLHVIDSEFKLACKIESTGSPMVDYAWNQYEKTEQLTFVQDHEVPVKPYRVESIEKISVSGDSKQKKYKKQLLATDNKRKQALVDMMHGVLEQKWEDELKKDVPKPQCMELKNVKDYTEDDLKAIEAYEKSKTALNDERMKYQKILEEEKTKIQDEIKKHVDGLDNQIFNLFQIKLKYNSAINQQCLKISRLSKIACDNDQRKQKIELYKKKQLEVEKTLGETVEQIANTEKTRKSLLDSVESLKLKKNDFNKNFKSMFISGLIYKRALRASNRIPTFQGSSNYSPLQGYQFIDKIMNPSDDRLEVLSADFVNYLQTLGEYDDFKNVDDNNLNFDMETWEKICQFRRMKIESEFRLKTCQKDVTDKKFLLEHFKHDKKEKEAMIEKFKMNIQDLKNQELFNQGDLKYFQLVINQGNIEIELTGHFEDFKNTVLVSKEWIDEMNGQIKELCNTKLNILAEYWHFLRKCRLLKIEHDILKDHKLTLYKYRLNYIKSLKITEDIQHYLKFKGKEVNFTKLAEHRVKKKRAVIENAYSKKKDALNQCLSDLRNDVTKIINKNNETDEKINEVNIKVYELKKKLDSSLNKEMKSAADLRMKNIVKRLKMMTNVQELHKEIVVLEATLELLRLKKFNFSSLQENTNVNEI